MRKRGGFTLIEVIMVTAVIALLSIIAVVNLRLAITRTKVARVESDLRTISHGLEAYQVDFSAYPPTNDLGTTPTLLTSPVAYLHGVRFLDPLYQPTKYETSQTSHQGRHYRYDNYSNEDPTDRYTAWHLQRYGSYMQYAGAPFAPGGRWTIDPDPVIGFSTLTPYDPTNGSVSAGRLIRGQRLI